MKSCRPLSALPRRRMPNNSIGGWVMAPWSIQGVSIPDRIHGDIEMSRVRLTIYGLLVSMTVSGAGAQERIKGLEVAPIQKQLGVDLSLELKARTKSSGEGRGLCSPQSCPAGRLALGE